MFASFVTIKVVISFECFTAQVGPIARWICCQSDLSKWELWSCGLSFGNRLSCDGVGARRCPASLYDGQARPHPKSCARSPLLWTSGTGGSVDVRPRSSTSPWECCPTCNSWVGRLRTLHHLPVARIAWKWPGWQYVRPDCSPESWGRSDCTFCPLHVHHHKFYSSAIESSPSLLSLIPLDLDSQYHSSYPNESDVHCWTGATRAPSSPASRFPSASSSIEASQQEFHGFRPSKSLGKYWSLGLSPAFSKRFYSSKDFEGTWHGWFDYLHRF